MCAIQLYSILEVKYALVQTVYYVLEFTICSIAVWLDAHLLFAY